MSNDEKNITSNHSSSFSGLFEEDLWKNWTSLSWKIVSTTEKSRDSLKIPQKTHNIDVKNLSVQEVTNILNSIIEIQENPRNKYIGPSGIDDWIIESLVRKNIHPTRLLHYLSNNNWKDPQVLLSNYKLALKLIQFCSSKNSCSLLAISDDHLVDSSLLAAFSESLSNKELVLFDKMKNLYVSKNSSVPREKSSKGKRQQMHPYITKFYTYMRRIGRKEKTLKSDLSSYTHFLNVSVK